MSYIIPLQSSEAVLHAVGGKGANLARLVRAGLPVPPGFLLSVQAYTDFVASNALDAVITQALTSADLEDIGQLEAVSSTIRQAFAGCVLGPELLAELHTAYSRLGAPAVAVRSSATAEDLPDMSFAGQQDTFLNIQGVAALETAVVRCWSSLWTARAIGYRARNHVAQSDVALAVVIQSMVEAAASGVMFTANPLSGCRHELVIDATLGLGEALVSGMVEPDHYLVKHRPAAKQDEISRKTLGAKATIIACCAGGGTVTVQSDNSARQALPDPLILKLASLGLRVQDLYGSPQDIEWAWDGEQIVLLQARPITSLYPLPAGIPAEPLQVMFALAAVQGVFEPFTPLGQDTLKLVLSGARRVYGYAPDFGEQTTFVSAAERLYINVTPVLRNRIGRKVAPVLIRAIDPGVAQAFAQIVNDERLAPEGPLLHSDTLRRILRLVGPGLARIVQIWRDPQLAQTHLTQKMDEALAAAGAQAAPQGNLWLDYDRGLPVLLAAQDLFPDLLVPLGVTAVVAGMAPFFGILQRFAAEAATATGRPAVAQLPLTIARSLPHNVTTEMDLALWQAAQVIRGDATTAAAFAAAVPADLAADYLAGCLPPVAQMAVAIFLHQYGMRGPGEIDIGRPRWREQPEPIMQVLQSYLAIRNPASAPDVVFRRGAAEADRAARELEDAVRATPGGALKARLVRWAVGRYRALGGQREAPKFFAIRYMGIVRQWLLHCGTQLAATGLLEQPDDIFFFTVPELQEIQVRRGVSQVLRTEVRARRVLYARELRRRQLPRVLLSDGTAFYEGVRADWKAGAPADPDVLAGDPVSPGVVEGTVHVVHSPAGTQLVPGEILVCPGTDPSWTPLFLAAGGLVMEVGGMMTHGSVVAREYGIPAVVGVHEATRRLHDGQRVRVDGMAGRVTVVTD
jgi:pyruvate,water dikinase